VILLLGIYPKEWDSGHNRDTCTPMSIAASTYNSQALETTQMTYNWWIDQETVVCIHNLEYYSAIGITTCFEGKWMQLEDIMLSEVSQEQKHKATCFLSHMEDRFKR
jgi:hypothetical protein